MILKISGTKFNDSYVGGGGFYLVGSFILVNVCWVLNMYEI